MDVLTRTLVETLQNGELPGRSNIWEKKGGLYCYSKKLSANTQVDRNCRRPRS